jgi:hypothetical protein
MNNYKLTVAYDDEQTIVWDAEIIDEKNAWTQFFSIKDWGFADEYSTVNLYTPSGKCYTKIFYREGRKVVER